MIDMVKANARPIAAIAGMVGLYVLVKWFPMAKDERELLLGITEVLGLGLIGFVPGFAKRQDPPQ